MSMVGNSLSERTPSPKLARNARRSLEHQEMEYSTGLPGAGPSDCLPLIISNRNPDLLATAWVESNLADIEARLLIHGAILFRGFPLDSSEDFSRVASILCGGLHGNYGDLPRAEIGDRIYQPTSYPINESILFHNEGAHLPAWPSKMCFHCRKPADKGGETTLLDCRDMWTFLDEDSRMKLETHGISYIRNFHQHLDQSWQAVFQEKDPIKVGDLCRAAGIAYEWAEKETLRTTYTVPARAAHPVSGEPLFFSQLLLFHPACLPSEVRNSLTLLYGEENLPRNATFGDGSPIPDSVILGLKDACERRAVGVPWQTGDFVLVDNMRVSHGRNPYEGGRGILVAMGGMCSRL